MYDERFIVFQRVRMQLSWTILRHIRKLHKSAIFFLLLFTCTVGGKTHIVVSTNLFSVLPFCFVNFNFFSYFIGAVYSALTIAFLAEKYLEIGARFCAFYNNNWNILASELDFNCIFSCMYLHTVAYAQ